WTCLIVEHVPGPIAAIDRTVIVVVVAVVVIRLRGAIVAVVVACVVGPAVVAVIACVVVAVGLASGDTERRRRDGDCDERLHAQPPVWRLNPSGGGAVPSTLPNAAERPCETT